MNGPLAAGSTTPKRRLAGSAAWDHVFAALFVGFLAFPWLDMAAKLDPLSPPVENRSLAEPPSFPTDRTEIDVYPAKWESYWDDHIGFRNSLIRWRNAFKFAVLGDSPQRSKVVVGEEGWFYDGYFEETVFKPFTQQQLEAKLAVLKSRREWLFERGVRYLVVLVPGQFTVYPEYLPDHLKKFSKGSRFRKASEFLAGSAGIEVIDLTDPLIRNKKAGRNYQKLDIHWNDRGALVGYECVRDQLERWFPAIRNPSRPEIEIVESVRPGWYFNHALSLPWDLLEQDYTARVQGQRHRIVEGALQWETQEASPRKLDLVVTEVDDASLPKAVIFIDSFGDHLIPLLSEHFKQAVWVKREPKFTEELIEAVAPDVVISQIYELNLVGLEIQNPVPTREANRREEKAPSQQS